MKHLFKSLITLATIALFASCAREPGDPRGVASGDRIPATFELKMDGVATKAFSDGNSANALLVGVYNKQGEGETAKYTYLDELSKRTVADAITVSGKAATFETNLVRGQNYVVVFWAQKSDCTAYAVDFAAEKLTVTTTGNANDESRDAFYKVFETGPITETNYNFVGIELTRPFAQINVLAPNEDVVAAAKSKVLFSKSALTVKKAPNTMDLLTGAVSGSADYTYSAAAITEPAFGDYANTHTYIAMDYILAGDTKGVYDVALDVYSTVGEVEQSPIHFDVTSAPAQRNYRTNIIGNVFTIDASFNIIINPIYNTPDYSEGLGLSFEPTTITPSVPATLPEGVSITPAGGTTPSVINFGVAALNASTPVTIPVTPSVNTTVKARSSNVAVATAEVVEGPGVKVTPVGPGEAVITIYTDAILATKSADVDSTKNYAGAKYEYKVVVEKPIEKKNVTIESQDINLKLNESATLEYEVKPEDAKVVITPAEGADEYFTWDAATKKVTAKKVTPAGGVGIELTVAETDTTKAASETVYVIISEKAVPTVVFDVFTLKVDETKVIEYQVEPKDLAVAFEVEKDQEVMGLVEVEGKNAVKGLKGGSAKLTLKIAETPTTAAFSKTVTINVDKLEATVKAKDFELTVGETKTLVAGTDFETASDGAVSLAVDTDDAEFLTVEPGTLKVKALKENAGGAGLIVKVAESDKYLAAEDVFAVVIKPAPVQDPVTATIEIEGVPTEAVEPGASFDVTITTNSTASVVVEATTGATVDLKSGNVYTVTAADDLTADTEVTLTASVAAVENAFTAAEKTAKFTVKKKEVVVPPTSSEYVKVTSTADVTDGVYLIVYEEGGLAFDGSLETLDAVGNTVEVTIANDKIAGTADIDAATFTLDVIDGGFSVKSASGLFIGQTSDANGLASGETAYVNVVTVDDEGANLVSGGAYLRYNSASNQTRFRYYKSSSYTGQKAVALYKKVGSGSGATPTQKEEPTLTINGTIPTEAMAKDATFDFSVETNSTGTISVKLAPEGAATVTAKANAEKTWTVTAGEPSAETNVTLTVSVAATDTYKAASATKTFKVAKKAGGEPTEVITATVAEFLAAKVSATQKYQLTGVVAKHNNNIDTTYGNFDLVDESGTVYVYGLTATEKELIITSETNFKGNNDKSYSTLGIEEGDVVTLIGYRGVFNTTIEVIGAYYVSHKADSTPKFGATINGETIAAAGGTKTVTVTGNVAWTASATGGATLSAASGEGAGTITVTIPANTSETLEPEYVVRVSTTADVATKEYSFTIKQNKYVAPSGDQAVLTNEEIVAALSSGEQTKDVYEEMSISSTSGTWKALVNAKNTLTYLQIRNKSNANITSPAFEKIIQKIVIHTASNATADRTIYAVPVDTDLSSTSSFTLDTFATNYGSVKTGTDGDVDVEIVFTADTKQFKLGVYGGATYVNSITVYFK